MIYQQAARTRRRRRVWASGLLAGYAAALTVIAMFPTPVDRPFDGFLDRWEARMPGFYVLLEYGSNIALFVPLGVLVALQLPRGLRWVGILIGAAVSVTIEVLQGALLPERVATPLDVVANTMGATIGVLLVGVVSLVGRLGRTLRQ